MSYNARFSGQISDLFWECILSFQCPSLILSYFSNSEIFLYILKLSAIFIFSVMVVLQMDAQTFCDLLLLLNSVILTLIAREYSENKIY